MKESVHPGDSRECTFHVVSAYTAAALGEAVRSTQHYPRVLSTVHLLSFMERVAGDVVQPCLQDGESSVGLSFDLHHEAPVPVGAEVRVRAVVKAIETRKFLIEIDAWDEGGLVAECTHWRVIVRMPLLEASARDRRRGATA